MRKEKLIYQLMMLKVKYLLFLNLVSIQVVKEVIDSFDKVLPSTKSNELLTIFLFSKKTN